MSTLESLIEDLRREVVAAQVEKEAAISECQQKETAFGNWKVQEQSLVDALEEAKANSSQNVSGLREELRVAQSIVEQLRSEQTGLLKQTHIRQSQLEEMNANLVNEVSSKQKEIIKLQRVIQGLGKNIPLL
jgi:hypothetical protein